MADLERSIPSMVDGLTRGQRKILFCCFKSNFFKEEIVAGFSVYVILHSAYHVGEQSCDLTIVRMAQDFVGSNNINLLQPNGQFGTRYMGGKDAAEKTWHLYTKLSPITRCLFPKDDDDLLDYLSENGKYVEPVWYMPIIPMVVVNGSEGVGTSRRSFIPSYNPRDVIANIRRLLNDEEMEPMHPWYRGFKGTIEQTTSREAGYSYTVCGIIEEVNETTLRITELPVHRWTQDYKEFLVSMSTGDDPFISKFRNYSDGTNVHFEVTLTKEKMMTAKQGLMKKFKLTTTFSINNMLLLDLKGMIKKYDTPEQILEEFFHIRLEYYEKRKKVLLDNLEQELLELENKVRFILALKSGEIRLDVRRADLCVDLLEKGIVPIPKKSKSVETAVAGAIEEPTEGVRVSDYDYLLSMPIVTLSSKKVQELCADKDRLNREVEELRKATPKSLWKKDLNDLDKELDELDQNTAREEEMVTGVKAQRKPPADSGFC